MTQPQLQYGNAVNDYQNLTIFIEKYQGWLWVDAF